GQQGVALFKKQGDGPLATGNDLNHLALNVASGTYEGLKADLEKHGVAVSGRPGDDRCIYFNDPDGHRLQLKVREDGRRTASGRACARGTLIRTSTPLPKSWSATSIRASARGCPSWRRTATPPGRSGARRTPISIGSARSSIAACSARRRRTRPSPAGAPTGEARSSRGRACRPI